MSSRAITVIKLVEALLHYRHYTDRGHGTLSSLHQWRPCCITVITPVEALLHYCHYTGGGSAATQLQNVTTVIRPVEALLHYCHYTSGGPAALLSLHRWRLCCNSATKRNCHH